MYTNELKYNIFLPCEHELTYLKVSMTSSGLNDYLDLKSLIEKYPQFHIGQLRWMVVRRKEYKLSNVIKKIGRRIYFNVPLFLEWINEQKF